MKKKLCKCGPSCSCRNCSCGPQAAFFGTLANEGRLAILIALGGGGKSVSELMTATGLEQTAASHALKQLEEKGFVSATRKGKYRIYTLNHKGIAPLLRMIDDHAHEHFSKHAKPCCCGGHV